MRAIIIYTDNTTETKEGLTEIHLGHQPGQIAFENDLAQVGCDKSLLGIKSVEIFND